MDTKHRTLVCLELKTTKFKSISYEDVNSDDNTSRMIHKHQIYGLTKFSEYDSVELVSDVCHYDMVLFIDLFGTAFDLPKNVNPACHDINQDIANYFDISETQAFDKSRENIIEVYNERIKEWLPESKPIIIEGDKHNSLYDAKVIQQIYNICK